MLYGCRFIRRRTTSIRRNKNDCFVNIGCSDGASTRKKIEDKFGEATPMTKKLSEGTGIVPSSISTLVLVGYVRIVVGVIGQIAS